MLKQISVDNAAALALELSRSITEMRTGLRQQVQQKLKEHELDITFELLEIMSLLWQKDGMSQQVLADTVIKDKSSVTYLIDNLVKRNLVTRSEDENDRRSKLIFLTPQGSQLRKKILPWVMDLYEKATYNISAKEISKAVLLVKKMNDNLHA